MMPPWSTRTDLRGSDQWTSFLKCHSSACPLHSCITQTRLPNALVRRLRSRTLHRIQQGGHLFPRRQLQGTTMEVRARCLWKGLVPAFILRPSISCLQFHALHGSRQRKLQPRKRRLHGLHGATPADLAHPSGGSHKRKAIFSTRHQPLLGRFQFSLSPASGDPAWREKLPHLCAPALSHRLVALQTLSQVRLPVCSARTRTTCLGRLPGIH